MTESDADRRHRQKLTDLFVNARVAFLNKWKPLQELLAKKKQ